MAKDGGLFGRIALGRGLLSPKTLAQALRLQEDLNAFGLKKPLGEILISTGFLEQEEVQLVLRLQERNKNKLLSRQFARVALKNEFLTAEQHDAALEAVEAKGYRHPIDELLVEQGVLEPRQARAIQSALERADTRRRARRDAPTRFFSREDITVELDEDDLLPDEGQEDWSQDLLFAAVALRDGLVLVHELERALRDRALRGEQPPRLHEVLTERGVLSGEQVEAVQRSLETSREERIHIPGYEVTDVLGQGATAVVLRARHELMDREVAIKVLRDEAVPGDGDQALEEARTGAQLQHPNVVVLWEVGRVQRRIYYVMELVDGPTLMQRIRREGCVPEREALGIALDVSRALEAVHSAGLVHRDIKPQNILVTAQGTSKLTDLGLACAVTNSAPEDEDGQIRGTPNTISPEQAEGKAVDIRSDLYSLGATLFYALTGRPPFDGPTALEILLAHINDPVPDPRHTNDELDEATARLVMRLLSKEPADRFDDPTALVEEIERLLLP